MVGIGKYAGNKFKSLSVTPLNDIKAMSTVLRKADYCVGNIYENIKSTIQFDDILDTYVDSMNKNPEDIGTTISILIVFECYISFPLL